MAVIKQDRVRVFRWDGETLCLTWMTVVMGITDVVVGFNARWWVTMYVVGLSASWFAAMRATYWGHRQIERLRAGGINEP